MSACLCSLYMQCLPWTLEETVLSSGTVRVVSHYEGAGNGTGGPLEEHLSSPQKPVGFLFSSHSCNIIIMQHFVHPELTVFPHFFLGLESVITLSFKIPSLVPGSILVCCFWFGFVYGVGSNMLNSWLLSHSLHSGATFWVFKTVEHRNTASTVLKLTLQTSLALSSTEIHLFCFPSIGIKGMQGTF